MIHVFVGPTLERSAPQLTVGNVQVHPPIRHGDLFTSSIADSDTVVLIDGVYHQAPALRHKEILAAMGRGVRVIGAASIGALRAAELAPFGMLGIGTVYTAYAREQIVGDDEVAVGQAPDGDLKALTWPVVNLRHVLDLAVRAGVIDGGGAERLLAALRAIYYPQRTMAAVLAVLRREGAAEAARWLELQRTHNRHFGDIKRVDALQAVEAALEGPTPVPGGRLPPEVWETGYFRRWSNAFARGRVEGLELATEDRLIYQQVFDPAFPETWAHYLEYRSLHPADGPGRPLAERLAQVTGGDLTADRVFHPTIDLRDAQSVSLLLAGETEQDREAVARYRAALQARRPRPGFSVAAVREDLTRRLLLRVWHCCEERFDAEASARGLMCGARAVESAKRLVPGLVEEAEAGMFVSSARIEVAHAAR
ncbi:TfuA-like protein [Streptomyces aureocirculatus]|uniref:TfuA-like protein n=1 Tax=Streptomyces aureocirculatus TaxID=67275 RepID=UPI000AD34210|nr:TfuA-like protein [Streptomyces aureocirculatus]